jgi:hypothetical protein
MTEAELAARIGLQEGPGAIRALFDPQAPPLEPEVDDLPPSEPGTAALGAVADALIRHGMRRYREYPRLIARVAIRWLLFAVGLCGVLGAGVELTPLRRLLNPPDLIAGANWTASSAEPGEASMTGRIPASVERPFFFHTAEDDSPFIEIEMPGSQLTVSRVVVDNRKDCCSARALPLAIELSDDRLHWTEVAQRRTAFERWSARFEPRSARWIRLRVLRRSRLHLQDVAAYR